MGRPVQIHFHATLPGEILRDLRFRDLLPTGLVRVEGLDGKKPAQLDISPALVPWAQLSRQLAMAWRNSGSLPRCFTPQARIPDPVIEALETATDADALLILRTLRKKGLLPLIRASASTTASKST